MREMKGEQFGLWMATVAGRTSAIDSGYERTRPVSREAVAQVDGLLALTSGMFGFAVVVVAVVGMLLF